MIVIHYFFVQHQQQKKNKKKKVSFLEESAISKGIFKILPLRVKNLFLRVLLIGLVYDIAFAGIVSAIFWCLCAFTDDRCYYYAWKIGFSGVIWILIMNTFIYPFVFAAGLNKENVSLETLESGIENARLLNNKQKTSRSAKVLNAM